MPKSSFYIAAIALGSVALSCTFLKDRIGEIQSPSASVSELPPFQEFDPKADPVSPGAVVARRLAELDPSLAVFVNEVESTERGALKRSIESYTNEYEKKADAPDSTLPTDAPPAATPRGKSWSTTSMLFAADALPSYGERASNIALITALMSGLKGFTAKYTDGPGFEASKPKTITETRDGTTTTTTMQVPVVDPNGSSTLDIEVTTVSEKNGVRLESKFKVRIEGADCLAPDGSVKLKAKIRMGGEAGGTGFNQEITADIHATVDDDANLADTKIDITQNLRESVGGKGMYLETAYTAAAAGSSKGYSVANRRIVRESQDVAYGGDRRTEMVNGAEQAATWAAFGILQMAEDTWKKGACVRIEANSPNKVAEGSTTQIPVKVVHKFDRTEVQSKLETTLTGGASVDPTLMPRTSGTLTYIAPGEKGQRAVMALKASSRRGLAFLELNANTGGNSFRVTAASNDVTFTGEICGLDKPFSLNATFPGGTAVMTFNPDGSMSSSGGGSGCTASGSGNFNLFLNDDLGGQLDWNSSDTVKCPMGFSNSRTNKFSVPLQPAPEVKCK